MPEIVLTPEQLAPLTAAAGRVEVKDQAGRLVGWWDPAPTPEQIAEWKRRAASPGPWFTSAQVFARLEALEAEWERTGGFTPEYAQEFVHRMDEQDPGHFRDGGRPR